MAVSMGCTHSQQVKPTTSRGCPSLPFLNVNQLLPRACCVPAPKTSLCPQTGVQRCCVCSVQGICYGERFVVSSPQGFCWRGCGTDTHAFAA